MSNKALLAALAAPSFTAPTLNQTIGNDYGNPPPFTASLESSGRMESLRVLIMEGKQAVADGHLAVGLRKYKTAMVTLPEAYKPRLQNKIARLEAQLDAERDRTEAVPSNSSRDLARVADADMGPLGLLQIVVQDMSIALAADMAGSNSGTICSSSSPRRSSPLVRHVRNREEANGSIKNTQSSPYGQGEGDESGVGSPPALVLDEDADEDEVENDSADSMAGEAHFGLGEGESVTAGTSKRERLEILNKDMHNALEKQVVDIMNTATRGDLTDLHGIGPQRAKLIFEHRAVSPFKTLADLSRIGMYPKQIEKMAKHNMLECLDVMPSSAV